MNTAVRTAASKRRLEVAWAWLSLIGLVIAWDRAARLDEPVRPSRVRLAHALEVETPESMGRSTSASGLGRSIRTR